MADHNHRNAHYQDFAIHYGAASRSRKSSLRIQEAFDRDGVVFLGTERTRNWGGSGD
jgi:hypothetical protein